MTNTNTNTNRNNNHNNAGADFMSAIQAMFNQTDIGMDLQKALKEADKIVNKKDKK